MAIPSTLRDSLISRLDRLAVVKEVAQPGAAIGRELSDVARRNDASLGGALVQLEESELAFRSGEPPEAQYVQACVGAGRRLRESLEEPAANPPWSHRPSAPRQFVGVAMSETELLAHHCRAGGPEGTGSRIFGPGRRYRPAPIGVRGSDRPPGPGIRNDGEASGPAKFVFLERLDLRPFRLFDF